jgi:hypothetical protein
MIIYLQKRIYIFLFLIIISYLVHSWDEEAGRLPTKCEVCKFTSMEVTSNLEKLNSEENIMNEYFSLETVKTANKILKKYKNS